MDALVYNLNLHRVSHSDAKSSLLTGKRHKNAFLATFPKFSHSSKETGYTSPGGILIPLYTGKLLIMKYTLPSTSIAPRLCGGMCGWSHHTRVVFLIIHFNRTCTTTWFSSISIDGVFSPSYIEFIVYY